MEWANTFRSRPAGLLEISPCELIEFYHIEAIRELKVTSRCGFASYASSKGYSLTELRHRLASTEP
jgi:hypothetical protein